MSISSMTNVAFARRADIGGKSASANSLESIAATKGDQTEAQSSSTAALSAIAAYIPTEILTIYVAVIAALNAPGAAASVTSAWVTFALFLVATPLVVWLVYAGKVKRAGKRLPTRIARWPRWEMFAATAAYVAWAFALPETPFASLGWYSNAIAAVVVLVVTTALGLVAPLAAQKLEG